MGLEMMDGFRQMHEKKFYSTNLAQVFAASGSAGERREDRCVNRKQNKHLEGILLRKAYQETALDAQPVCLSSNLLAHFFRTQNSKYLAAFR